MLRLLLIAIVCTGLLIPIAGYSSNIISSPPLLIAVTFGLGYVALPALLLRLWPARKATAHKGLDAALEDGDLLTVEHAVLAVAQIEEFEDEGLHFFVTVETGETLYLGGQYLYGHVERHAFPSGRVRLFKHKVTGCNFGIEPIGQPLTHWPVFVAKSEDWDSLSGYAEDGALYPQLLSDIVAGLALRPDSPASRAHA